MQYPSNSVSGNNSLFFLILYTYEYVSVSVWGAQGQKYGVLSANRIQQQCSANLA